MGLYFFLIVWTSIVVSRIIRGKTMTGQPALSLSTFWEPLFIPLLMGAITTLSLIICAVGFRGGDIPRYYLFTFLPLVLAGAWGGACVTCIHGSKPKPPLEVWWFWREHLYPFYAWVSSLPPLFFITIGETSKRFIPLAGGNITTSFRSKLSGRSSNMFSRTTLRYTVCGLHT